MQRYYNQIWSQKLSLPQYATLEKRWRSRWTFALSEIDDGMAVLDAACGDGVFGEMVIKQKQSQVVGLDISNIALAQAAKRGLVTHHCNISTDPFPVKPASFDVVTMLCCLEHIFDPAFALNEAARAVKPGGKVLVTLPNAVHYRFRWDFLRGRLSADLLHTNDGEGLHVQFFNFTDDFDRFVVQNLSQLQLTKKIPTLKNPGKYGIVSSWLQELGLQVRPNLFAEYANFVLVKKPKISKKMG